MEHTAGLLKLKTGYKEDLAEWRNVLTSKSAEVIESLRQEGVDLECWFHIEIGGEPYLLWFIRVESMDRARDVFARSTLDIDLFHKDKMAKMKDFGIAADLLAAFSAD